MQTTDNGPVTVTAPTATAPADKTQTTNADHEGFFRRIAGVGTTVIHGIEVPFELLGKVDKVIGSVIKDQPELKSILTTMVTKAEAIGVNTAGIVASKGLSFAQDETAMAEITDFFAFVKNTVVPEFIKVYGEIKTDVTAEETAAATAAVKA